MRCSCQRSRLGNSPDSGEGHVDMNENDRTKQILTDLEGVRENLLALSDDIWLSIDHNDLAALDAGYAFKREYIQKMEQFDNLASDISELIQGYTKVSVESGNGHAAKPGSENDRIIKELDKEEAHYLDEDFCYKRPYGFILRGQAFKDLVTWKRLYTVVCVLLIQIDSDRFDKLPANPKFISSQGNPYFATDRSKLRVATSVTDTIFAETNLSANMIRDSIRRLLEEFSIDPSELKLYLRQDRNAADEVKLDGPMES